MKNENAYDEAREIQGTIRDLQVDEIVGEVEALVRKHRSTASNEIIAVIAYDAFCDACEAWDIPTSEAHFNSFFPGLAGS